jgi:hypothetical protein
LSNPFDPPLRITLKLWILLWLFFLLWPNARNRNLWLEYATLIRSDVETRRAVSYGRDFFEFLEFCKRSLPAGSTFRLVGVTSQDIARVRALYYLYPCLQSESPQYTLVYRAPSFRLEGASICAALDTSRYVLRNSAQVTP